MPESKHASNDAHDHPAQGGAIVCAGGRPHSFIKTVLMTAAYVVLFAGAFEWMHAWPLALLAPAPLAWMAINARTSKRAVLTALVGGLIAWLWLQRWVVSVTPAGFPMLALVLAVYGVLFTWLIRRIARHGKLSRLPMAVLVPIVWVGLEFLRGDLVAYGYPWFLLGHPLIEWPVLAQSADLLGPYLGSFIAAMLAGAAVDAVRWHAKQLPGRTAVAGMVLAAAGMAMNLGYGMYRMGEEVDFGAPLEVIAIQTNLPQNNKIAWSMEDQQRDVGRFFKLTEEALAESEGVDLVVWPETMMPVRGLDIETLMTLQEWGQSQQIGFVDRMLDIQAETGIPWLVGAASHVGLRVEEHDGARLWAWDAQYNSAYLVDGLDSIQRYDKVHLTPFGEVMPYISEWPWLEQKLLGIGAPGMSFGLDAADEPAVLTLKRGERTYRLGTPICFEDTVASVVRRMAQADDAESLDIVINLSNDGWFGWHETGRRQHAQIARWRCVEQRVPMVRCANTGLSVAIDSCGRVVGRVGEGRYGLAQCEGVLRASVRPDPRRTMYGTMGDVLGWLCLVFMGASAAWVLIRRKQGS